MEKGYKVFNQYLECRGFKYEVGKTYTESFKPICCERGFHYCTDLKDCFNYYTFDPHNKVAEIIAHGEIDRKSDNSKCCTSKIEIVREISWEEVLRLVNIGKSCSGFCNSGNRNSGNWNSGNRNSGDWNSGNRNSGDWNSGNCNSGNCNSGNCNSGDWNSGNCNSGNWNSGNRNSGNCNSGNRNSGDWNKTNFASGCFNTSEPKINLFNKPSNWTYLDWIHSDARSLLNQINASPTEWISEQRMSDKEKEIHPDYKITGGYLKEKDTWDTSNEANEWWSGLSNDEKQIIKDIPNFDASIFKEITGIDVN